MKHIRLKRLGMPCLVLIALLGTSLTSSLVAQDSKTLLTSRIIEVVGGKTSEFADLQREFAEARTKAGSPGRWVWQETRGNTNRFHIITVGENLAEQDEPEASPLGEVGWATWISRMGAIIKTREVVTVRLHPELEIQPRKGYQPNLLVLRNTQVVWGKNTAYQEWLTDVLVPAFKKTGNTGWSVGKTIYGGNIHTWSSVRHYASWAELDAPGSLTKLSDAERQAILDGMEGIVEEVSTTILRYRADLSNDDPK
jgi:hypothetical protein